MDDFQSEQSLRSPSDQESEQLVLALRQMLTAHSGEHQLVLLQDFPDPDALSSAWTYQLIAKTYDITCDIFYAGTLSHQENIALVKLRDLRINKVPLILEGSWEKNSTPLI